jgi:hypothetical protein
MVFNLRRYDSGAGIFDDGSDPEPDPRFLP